MKSQNFTAILIFIRIKEEQKLKIFRTCSNKFIELKRKETNFLKMLRDQMLI